MIDKARELKIAEQLRYKNEARIKYMNRQDIIQLSPLTFSKGELKLFLRALDRYIKYLKENPNEVKEFDSSEDQ